MKLRDLLALALVPAGLLALSAGAPVSRTAEPPAEPLVATPRRRAGASRWTCPRV